MNQERICLECGELLHGRADQKFCCDQCRNAWHNHQSGDACRIVRKINRILRKNQAILDALWKGGKRYMTRNELENLDFNFHYFTHCRTSRQGRTIYYCYGQGYAPVNGERVKIVRPFLPGGLYNLPDIRQ